MWSLIERPLSVFLFILYDLFIYIYLFYSFLCCDSVSFCLMETKNKNKVCKGTGPPLHQAPPPAPAPSPMIVARGSRHLRSSCTSNRQLPLCLSSAVFCFLKNTIFIPNLFPLFSSPAWQQSSSSVTIGGQDSEQGVGGVGGGGSSVIRAASNTLSVFRLQTYGGWMLLCPACWLKGGL